MPASTAVGIDRADKMWSVRSVQVANPAAGAEFSVTVPAGVVWRLVSVYAQLVTSATVATRLSQLVITDGANKLFVTVGGGGTPAGQTINMLWANGLPQGASETGNVALAPTPVNLVLPAGFVISTNTLNIQVGDQYSLISLLVEQADAEQ